jgi:signal transduction histidine kinase
MNIYAVPMLISGILCTVLAIVTWLFRRRESINRVFSFFTFTLALDSFVFFITYQFENQIDNIELWLRFVMSIGLLVPIGIILFFFAFTGYDKRLDEKILGIKVKHFKYTILLYIVFCMFLSVFTDLLFTFEVSQLISGEVNFGPVGKIMYPLFACIFFYLFVMVFKAYKTTSSKPRKRFILLLAIGAFMFVTAGYSAAFLFSAESDQSQSIGNIGTAIMAIFFFVALVNYQFDKFQELNLNLEQKVEERTRHLRETQAQLVQSEKVAALGHLVAGVAHEMNSPVGVIYSTYDTLALATEKLKQTLESEHGIKIGESKKVSHIMKVVSDVSTTLRMSSERITDIVKRLKVFAQLDEADLQSVNFNECVENTLDMFKFHLKSEIVIRKEFADLPELTCSPAKINQLCFQLLRNANQAINETGEIILRTEIQGDKINFSVSDNGRGIAADKIDRIFDPGYTSWDLNVGTGLGLAICYQVAKDHNGEIRVESEVGKGSKFIFSLPLN